MPIAVRVFCIGFKVNSELRQSRFLGPVTFSPRGEKTRVNIATQLEREYKVNITALADAHFNIPCEKVKYGNTRTNRGLLK